MKNLFKAIFRSRKTFKEQENDLQPKGFKTVGEKPANLNILAAKMFKHEAEILARF